MRNYPEDAPKAPLTDLRLDAVALNHAVLTWQAEGLRLQAAVNRMHGSLAELGRKEEYKRKAARPGPTDHAA